MDTPVESLLPEALRSQLRSQLHQLDIERKQLTDALNKLESRRNAIVGMLTAYGEGGNYQKDSPERSGLSSLEMARVVLRNTGRPLPMSEIYDLIQETYGIPAAKTLKDMLWKRSRSRNIFFKDEDGAIGLVELEAVVETVAKTGEAVA